MTPEPVADALRAAQLADQPLRHATRGLSADGWIVGDPPLAFVKWRADQPHRIRPEVAALQTLQRNGFGSAPRLLAVSSCATAFVATWQPGRALDRIDVPTDAVRAVGTTVARLHQIRIERESGMKRSTDPLGIGDRVLSTARRDAARSDIPLDDAVTWLRDRRPGDLVDGRFVHRDLRAANILVADQTPALVDFERACAGDPAWDWVKLRWWTLDGLPRDLLDAFRDGYTEVASPPSRARVRWFAMAEAVGLAARFGGHYRRQAVRQIDALLDDSALPRWRGGSIQSGDEDGRAS